MSSFARTTNVTWTDTARQLPGSSDRTGTSAAEAAPGPSARRQLSALEMEANKAAATRAELDRLKAILLDRGQHGRLPPEQARL